MTVADQLLHQKLNKCIFLGLVIINILSVDLTVGVVALLDGEKVFKEEFDV